MDNRNPPKPRQGKPKRPLRPLGEVMHEIAMKIPPEAWEGIPKGASKRFDDFMEPEWIDGKPVFPDQ